MNVLHLDSPPVLVDGEVRVSVRGHLVALVSDVPAATLVDRLGPRAVLFVSDITGRRCELVDLVADESSWTVDDLLG